MKIRHIMITFFLCIFADIMMSASSDATIDTMSDEVMDVELNQQVQKTFMQEIKEGSVEGVKFIIKWTIPAVVIYLYIVKPAFACIHDLNNNFGEFNKGVHQLVPEVAKINEMLPQVLVPFESIARAAIEVQTDVGKMIEPTIKTIEQVGLTAQQIGEASGPLAKAAESGGLTADAIKDWIKTNPISKFFGGSPF